MTPLFKKLNFKNQSSILCVNHPLFFQQELDAMKEVVPVSSEIYKIDSIEFAIAFVTEKEMIGEIIREIALRWSNDPVLWFCYPKGSSRKYTCNFNRDTGWESLGLYGLEAVRQVAIDGDWSALRFRKVANIKHLSRKESFALSEEGKQRINPLENNGK